MKYALILVMLSGVMPIDQCVCVYVCVLLCVCMWHTIMTIYAANVTGIVCVSLCVCVCRSGVVCIANDFHTISIDH